jgi:hypothetical protein
MTTDELIITCAVRYALGRQSYIVGVVSDYVANKCKVLSESCKKIIMQDIMEEIEFYHRQGRTVGMKCDEQAWLNLLTKLKEEGGLNEQSRKTQNSEKTE